ncbi:uncharacterized protein V6R79_001034 [Siganus canaliculatus]
MPVSVRQVHVSSEPDSSYFLRVDWKGRGLAAGFQLLLTDGQDAWRGEVSGASLCSEAEELEMPMERYVQDLQQALTQTGSDVTYSFSLAPPPPDRRSAVTLAYEKVQRDISFQLGSVVLTLVPEPAAAVRDLLVHSLQRGTSLKNQNQRLEQENQRLRGEQQRITADLRRYTGGKEDLEAELFSRFVLVLNEKKAKIRSLQQTVTNLQEASSEAQGREGSSASDRAAAPEEEEDDYGGSTDEEEQPPASSSSAPAPAAASPLDAGLKDITDVAPSRKRRFRHLADPEPTVKRPSQQRDPAGSSQTPQSSADAAASEADDLFDDF